MNLQRSTAYAVRVRGDSMRPRIRNGEYVIAEPSFLPKPGQDVVVKLKDGRAMVKELLFSNEDEVILGTANDEIAPLMLPLEIIQSIHVVSAIMPAGALN